jgi:hypothetical protein
MQAVRGRCSAARLLVPFCQSMTSVNNRGTTAEQSEDSSHNRASAAAVPGVRIACPKPAGWAK